MTHEIFLPVLLGFMTCTSDGSPPERHRDLAASADLAGADLAGADLAAPGDGGTGTDGGARDLVMASDGPIARSGLEAFCDHYKRCGGWFYETSAACVKATLDYWKVCRLPELNVWGNCMVAKVPCGSWDPDRYNANSNACSPEWEKVRKNMCAPLGD
jgi:hypothetical protein